MKAYQSHGFKNIIHAVSKPCKCIIFKYVIFKKYFSLYLSVDWTFKTAITIIYTLSLQIETEY